MSQYVTTAECFLNCIIVNSICFLVYVIFKSIHWLIRVHKKKVSDSNETKQKHKYVETQKTYPFRHHNTQSFESLESVPDALDDNYEAPPSHIPNDF